MSNVSRSYCPKLAILSSAGECGDAIKVAAKSDQIVDHRDLLGSADYENR